MTRRRVVTGFVKRERKRDSNSKGEVDDSAEDVLVLQRSQDVRSYQGRWACISGSVEEEEQPQAAMWREMCEETGWVEGRDLQLVRPGLPIDVDDSPKPGKTYSFRVHPFLFSLQSGTTSRDSPQIDWEHTGYQWVSAEGMREMDEGGETVPRLFETLQRVWDPPAMITDSGLQQRARGLFNDHQRGAAELAKDAAELVLAGADAESIAALRPTMVPLVNAARRAAELKAGGDAVQAELAAALDRAAVEAAEALRPYATVATFSRSSSVVAAVQRIAEREDGSLRAVFVGASMPGGEGVSAAELISSATGATLARSAQSPRDHNSSERDNLAVSVLPDDQLEQRISDRKVDVLVLGADAVLRGGTVVNKAGSARLARACARAVPPIPVVVVADQFKAWDDDCPPCLEEAFEVVPHDLISKVVGLDVP